MKKVETVKNHDFNGQSPLEREQRLKEWNSVLEKIPYTELVKGYFKKISDDDFVLDNEDEFGDSLFILRISPDINYHSQASMILFFCFKASGEGYLSICDEPSHFELGDPVVDVMLNYLDQLNFETWNEMLETIIEMLNKAYQDKIPSPK